MKEVELLLHDIRNSKFLTAPTFGALYRKLAAFYSQALQLLIYRVLDKHTKRKDFGKNK